MLNEILNANNEERKTSPFFSRTTRTVPRDHSMKYVNNSPRKAAKKFNWFIYTEKKNNGPLKCFSDESSGIRYKRFRINKSI